MLRRTGMPAERLVLEITESVLLDDMDQHRSPRWPGSATAASGWPSTTSAPATARCPTSPSCPSTCSRSTSPSSTRSAADTPDASLVEAIIAMSHSMRLTTVAEGVEHPEQAAWLQDARCSIGQGYLWSRPVELAAARALLLRRHAPSQRPRSARATACSSPPDARPASVAAQGGRRPSSTPASSIVRGHGRRPCRRRSRASSCAGSCRERVFGSAGDDRDVLERRDRADLVAHLGDQLARELARGRSSTPALSTTKPRGTWPFSGSATPITAHSATAGCGGEHRLHRAGREPVPGDVDDVVGAAHDVEVAVLVDVPAVAGEVVAVEAPRGTTTTYRSSSPHSVGSVPGGSGSRRQIAPSAPGRHGRLPVLVEDLRRRTPGTGTVGRARLDRHRVEAAQVRRDRPAGLGLPPVVDHRDAEHARWPSGRSRGRAAPRPGTACGSG